MNTILVFYFALPRLPLSLPERKLCYRQWWLEDRFATMTLQSRSQIYAVKQKNWIFKGDVQLLHMNLFTNYLTVLKLMLYLEWLLKRTTRSLTKSNCPWTSLNFGLLFYVTLQVYRTGTKTTLLVRTIVQYCVRYNWLIFISLF